MIDSTANSKAVYEAWHDRMEVDREPDTPWHRLVKSHLDYPRDVGGKRILEIGCGRGGFACWLASQSPSPAEIVATDFASTAIETDADNSRGLSLRVGVAVGAREIEVLLRNVHGHVRFRASLDALRRVLDARRPATAATPPESAP